MYVKGEGEGGGKGQGDVPQKKRKERRTRRDSPNSANPVTVSMVGAARMILLLKRIAKAAKLE